MSATGTSSTVRAVVVDMNAPGKMVLQDVAAPEPKANEAMVRVAAFSLNRGEVRQSLSAKESGGRPGWDVAGTVERAAADGSGPAAGMRVVGFLGAGGWAERVAVPTDSLAPLPDGLSFAQAATLPVAGLTALHAVRKGGNLSGKAVLITGASGGVGYFAAQLAKNAGATVTAVLRQERYADLVRELGVANTVVSADAAEAGQYGPYHLIVDATAGPVMAQAFAMLAPGGTYVLYGTSAGEGEALPLSKFYGAGGATLYGLSMYFELRNEPASVGLAHLAELMVRGELRVRIDIEEPWTNVADVAQRLLDRAYPGKAVLIVA